jgi:hypothetical protein
MAKPTDEQFETACRAYEQYVAGLRRFVEAMEAVGVQVRNVEPFANFAEVIAAHEFGGTIQPPTNEGYDLLTDEGVRIQVKSLRVSSAKPGDNGLDWIYSTRIKGKKEEELIKAERLVIVVYLDFAPYAMLDFPIEHRETFPVLGRKGMGFHHIQQLVDGTLSTAGTSVRVIDLRGREPLQVPATPPTTPAVGE